MSTTTASRLLLGVCIAVVVIAFIVGYLHSTRGQGIAADPPSKHDRHILDLERAAVDDAFRLYVQNLYSTWMRDPTGQPARAQKGAQQARRTYIQMQDRFDQRQKELER